MKHTNCTILSGPDTGSVNGAQIDANNLYNASFQSIFGDATATGTVKLQASNDICAFGNLAADFTVTNWTDIANATAAVASGVAPLIILTNMSYRWIRAVYTRSSGGSTTVTVNMMATGV